MPSVKINFLYSSVLTTANYIFPFLTFPYVSRVLGVTNVGIVNFVDSVIQYFILFSMMGITTVGIREIAKNKCNQEKLNEAFNSLFWLNTLSTTIALIFLIIVTFSVPQLFIHWEMMLVGGLKLLCNYLLIDWFYKGLEEFRFITIRTLMVKIVYVIAVFLLVKDRSDYIVYYLLLSLMFTFNAIINLVYARHFIKWRFRSISIGLYLSPFLMLGVYMLLTSMYTSFNMAYLGFVSSETEVGYYATAFKLYSVLIALFSAFTGVMLPRMSSLLSEGKLNEFKSLLAKSIDILFTFSVPIIIFAIIYAPNFIGIIAGYGYEGAVLPMRIMMPLLLIIGYEQILIVQTLMPLKKDKAILRNSCWGAFVGILLNLILVYNLKSIGSSIVWLLSEITVLCGGQYYVSKYVGYRFPWNKLFKNITMNIPFALILIVISTLSGMILPLLLASISAIVYFIILQTIIYPNPEIQKIIQQINHRFNNV